MYINSIDRRRSIMPRVVLLEQPRYEFKYEITILNQHLNYAGHLGNDALIGLIQKARIGVFNALGYKELDLGDGKTGIIIGDLAVNFKAEGFLNDKLRIESQVGDVTDKSIRICHRVIKEKDDVVLALVETGLVAFDYASRKITVLPEKFAETLTGSLEFQV